MVGRGAFVSIGTGPSKSLEMHDLAVRESEWTELPRRAVLVLPASSVPFRCRVGYLQNT